MNYWEIHSIVMGIEHDEFGHVQLKTEIHELNSPSPITFTYCNVLF
jgi:hypothetical protein